MSVEGAQIVVIVGNPRPNSRTKQVAERLASGLAESVSPVLVGVSVIDLAGFGGAVLERDAPDVDAALETVRNAGVLIVATPVYKASYTGLLKAFLDRFNGPALAGIAAVPLTVSAAPTHRLTADVHLRPLLVELGASVPTRAFAIEESALADLDPVLTDWLKTEAGFVSGALRKGVDA
ncbi:NADPH-dependent FMN reductase [Flindersiella endophytica]